MGPQQFFAVVRGCFSKKHLKNGYSTADTFAANCQFGAVFGLEKSAISSIVVDY